MSGGRRDIFIWTSPHRLELSLFFTVLIFFQILSFQVLHLPFVFSSASLVFIYHSWAQMFLDWNLGSVCSVHVTCQIHRNGKGYISEVCLLAMSWLKAFLIMSFNYHLLSSQVEEPSQVAVNESIHALPLPFCKLSALSVLWERGVLETGRWEMHPKGLVREADASGLLNGHFFTFVSSFMLIPLIFVRLPRR